MITPLSVFFLLLTPTNVESKAEIFKNEVFEEEIASNSGYRSLDFSWKYSKQSDHIDIELSIPLKQDKNQIRRYASMYKRDIRSGVVRDLSRETRQEYYRNIKTEDPYHEILDEVAMELAFAAKESGISVLELAVSFVQNIPYKQGHTHQMFPSEIMLRGYGDCSDKSLLLAALMDRFQVAYRLVSFPQQNHMGIAVDAKQQYGTYWLFEGNKYFYVETTNPWDIGEFPEDLKEGWMKKKDPVAMLLDCGM